MPRQWSIFIAISIVGCAPPPELGTGGDARVDPVQLDREAAGGACGFPTAGERGYGTGVGQRLANNDALRLVDCSGESVELADFFCERDDAYGDFNRGIFINIGAGWCSPCQEETLSFPDLYEEFHGRGIEFVQVLFQDWNAQAPTEQFCADWRDGKWIDDEGEHAGVESSLPYPIVMDQVFEWTSVYLADPSAATPMNILVDANGNIRWKLEGQKPDHAMLRSQFELVIGDPYAPPS